MLMTKNLKRVGQRHRYYPRLHGSQAVNLIIIIFVIISIIICDIINTIISIVISISKNFVTIVTLIIIIDNEM